MTEDEILEEHVGLDKYRWKAMRPKGSHRHSKHHQQSWLITVPRNDGKKLAAGTLNAIP
jgi:predicted RNA binding protein YcfA (HicA-like mRNA interferase family)